MKPEQIKATDILITHGHSDHTGDAAQIAKANDCKITSSFHTAKYFEKQGVKTNPVAVGGRLKMPWGSAYFRTAMHTGFHSDETSFGPAASILLTFKDSGARIYHLGDTEIHEDFKLVGELFRPDIALVPIGGRFTMDIDEAVIATKWLKTDIVIPIHYNTFPLIKADPNEFKEKVEKETSAKCIILEA